MTNPAPGELRVVVALSGGGHRAACWSSGALLALVDSGVDKISVTGSVITVIKVGEACGRNLIPCTLELCGKDTMVLFADADIERAAAAADIGAIMNTGQYSC